MWEFKTIWSMAIHKMSLLKIEPRGKVMLAREYRVGDWLIPALQKWVEQDCAIQNGDVDRFGLDFILKLVEARRQSCICLGHRMSSSPTIVIEKLFRDELKDVGYTYGNSGQLGYSSGSGVVLPSSSFRSVKRSRT
jgi:hypothetical protein